jgi:hypothetical protein
MHLDAGSDFQHRVMTSLYGMSSSLHKRLVLNDEARFHSQNEKSLKET